MKTTEYTAEKVIAVALEDVLKSDAQFKPLLDNLHIAACFRVATNTDGETQKAMADPVVLKKVPAEVRPFLPEDRKLHFIMIVDYFFWENASDSERHGHMSKVLSRVQVEKTDEGPKVTIKKWDIQDTISNIRANGQYTETHTLLYDALRASKRLLSVAQAHVDQTPPEKAVAEAPAPASPVSSIRARGARVDVKPTPAAPVTDPEQALPRRRSAAPVDVVEPEADPEPDPEPALEPEEQEE